MEHPVVGTYRQFGPGPRFTETPGKIVRTAPLLGEHNQEIFGGELQLEQNDLLALAARGVI